MQCIAGQVCRTRLSALMRVPDLGNLYDRPIRFCHKCPTPRRIRQNSSYADRHHLNLAHIAQDCWKPRPHLPTSPNNPRRYAQFGRHTGMPPSPPNLDWSAVSTGLNSGVRVLTKSWNCEHFSRRAAQCEIVGLTLPGIPARRRQGLQAAYTAFTQGGEVSVSEDDHKSDLGAPLGHERPKKMLCAHCCGSHALLHDHLLSALSPPHRAPATRAARTRCCATCCSPGR